MFFSGAPRPWQALRKTGRWLTLAMLTTALLAGNLVWAREQISGATSLSQLPPEAQITYRLITAGGPFPNRKDGVVFGNREHALPAAPRGFYREYTVHTPRVKARGARRIVCGGRNQRHPDDCFYTDDHYATFQRIVH